MNYEKQICLVTGSSGDIGSAICERLTRENQFQVIGIDLSAKTHTVLHSYYECDVSHHAAILSLNKKLEAAGIKVAAIVNCAGILSTKSFMEESPEDWQRVIDVNLGSVFNISKIFTPSLIRNGGGGIVNVASISAFRPSMFSSASYCASKAGIIGMSRTMAAQLGAYGIRVNCVSPGVVESAMLQDIPDTVIAEYRNRAPLGQTVKPGRVAAAVEFLLSDAASDITGETIHVNCGSYMA